MGLSTDWRGLHGTFFSGRRVLVTGGAGFIGSHLVEALLSVEALVVVLDDLSAGQASNLPTSDRLELLHGSIAHTDALTRAMQGCDVVFHLAALVSVPRSLTNPRLYHDVNASGTLNVLEAARRGGVRRVVYSASSSAYGDSIELPKVETMPELPRSPYAATKLAGEQYMRAFAACYEVDAVSLRYFNIFGPRQNPHSAYAGVIAAFSKAILAGRPPIITGDGSASRDFTYVHNAVHANLLAARRNEPLLGEVMNIATGQSRTILELAQTMVDQLASPKTLYTAAQTALTDRAYLAHPPGSLGSPAVPGSACNTPPAPTSTTPLAPTFAPPRGGDVMHSLANLDRARSMIGYAPIVGFDEGLAQTLAWYRRTLAAH